MDRDTFNGFYMATARSVWAYLATVTGDPALADDLTQEAYLRLMTADVDSLDDDHRRHYLFRIASNLVGDHFRAIRRIGPMPETEPSIADKSNLVDTQDLLARAFSRVSPADRELLWLAYAEEISHREIAALTGYKENSVRPLLHRARHRALSIVHKLLGGV
jgi:RNA polymerase sigma-70 factor (ECF subfamily)